ncbi:MAG: hypothetical protein EPO26_14965 [Chloroflexota bacterium]|nr:MAG: hypothetical protein EPO26_14965 [Chloroflexota bacterium]
MFGGLIQLPTDEAMWIHAIRLGIDLRRQGVAVQGTDLMIATAAIRADATLVHRDSDFDRIAKHCDLRVESYV